MSQNQKRSQLKPSTKEPMMKDIPYLNLHINEFKNPNMCAHKGDKKL